MSEDELDARLGQLAQSMGYTLTTSSGRRYRFDLTGWRQKGEMTEEASVTLAKKFIRYWDKGNPARKIEGNDYSEVLRILANEFFKTGQALKRIEENQRKKVNDQ